MKIIPELFGEWECWLPLDAVRAGGTDGLPFLGLFGNVSAIDIKLAIGLCNGTIDEAGGVPSPNVIAVG